MAWSDLGTQFCLELAVGVLVAMAFVPKAPVVVLFYRVMGTSALVPCLVALVIPPWVGLIPWLSVETFAIGVAVAAFPFYSGPLRGKPWAASLGVAILGCAVALAVTIGRSVPDAGPRALAVVSALATGTVAGSVGLAMVLGHWYLTVPNLAVSHLRRLNRVTVASMVVSLVAIAASCLMFQAHLESAKTPLFGPWGLFHLGTRVVVGLALPLLFAWMTASSLKFENTRSATGILYASTVLVLIGAAVSLSLKDSYGIPL